MPGQGLPVGQDAVRTRKRPKQTQKLVTTSMIAHEIGDKARTEDVLTEDNKDKDFSSLMLSEPVLKGLK